MRRQGGVPIIRPTERENRLSADIFTARCLCKCRTGRRRTNADFLVPRFPPTPPLPCRRRYPASRRRRPIRHHPHHTYSVPTDHPVDRRGIACSARHGSSRGGGTVPVLDPGQCFSATFLPTYGPLDIMR